MRKPYFWRVPRPRVTHRSIQRTTVWVALIAQLSAGVPIAALAREVDREPQPTKSTSPSPAPTVHVNRTVPKVTPPSARPTFSATPGDAEITSARIFGEPLVPIGRGTLPGENHALADAVTRYLDAHNPEQVLPFLGFLKTYPDSPWRASLLLNLGLVYRHTGYFLRALDVWEQTWNATKTGTDAKSRAVADRTVGELFALNARLGRFERLDALFAETKDRVVTGPATEQITAAREGLWMMRNTPEKAFLCGPLAVDQVLAASRAGYVRDEKILQARSTPQGTSLAQMQKLAADLNLPLTMVKRAPGAVVLLPAVMHWKAGHFAALIREADGKFLVRDPTFGDELWVSKTALDEEASGYMLVKSQAWPDGWRPVEPAEGEQVWGKGQTDGSDPDDTHDNDEQAGGDAGNPGNSNRGDPDNPEDQTPQADNPDGDDDADNDNPADDGSGDPDEEPDDHPDDDDRCPEEGMAKYTIHLMVVSLHVRDTPMGHATPYGPSMAFTVVYNQREAHQPQVFSFSHLGPKWTFKWLSYIEDDPTNAFATAYLATRGGGRDPFSGFNPGTQTFQQDPRTGAVLVRVSDTPVRYERRLTNGAVQVFTQPDGATTFPRRVFMTEARDSHGNSVTFTYDSQLRLVAASDPLGQVTTLSYDDASDSRRITRVTDPFGRFATFEYDTAGRLARITDVVGLQSSFAYDGGDFITALTTPYGTTHFTKGENGQDRWLEVTDPLGGKERAEYKGNSPVPSSDPDASVPTNVGINNYLNYRNTFFWNKRAMSLAPRDVASAHRYHWLHTGGPLNQTSGTLESEQRPLEARVWYRYPGQTSSLVAGTSTRRTVVARVVDDGTTQSWTREYNAQNHLTKRTDPLGRETTYSYAGNGIDLLEVRQTTGGINDLLVSYSNYTSHHQPQMITDAAGQATTLTYNSHGQVLTATNAKSETTTFTYDTNGYPQSVTRPLTGATTSYTYDAYGRVRTTTDRDGYVLTFDYDALNRQTRVTYPDATFEQTNYDRLDAAERRDRLGRKTTLFRDALRHVVAVRDPIGRTTVAQWCGCGSLDALVDALGRKTSWTRDLRGRVTQELRPDGVTARTFTYETTTSRRKTITDPRGQVTTYAYNRDNSVQSVAYSNTAVATPSVSFTYDANYKRVVTMVDGTGTTTYTYKPVGVLGARSIATVDGPLSNDTITYDYDELGRTVSRAINGVTSGWTYDTLGRTATEVNALGTFTYGYDATTHRVASVVYPNGQNSNYSYYGNAGDHRLQTIHHKLANGVTLSKYDYTYDLGGNILTWQQQADTSAPTVWSYIYDADDRLVNAVRRSTDSTPVVLNRFAYGYDAEANRVTEQIDDAVSASDHDALNRLTGTQPGGQIRVVGTVSEPATVTIQGKPADVAADHTFVGQASLQAGSNVLTITAQDPSGNTQTNQYAVTAVGNTTTISYDANGNLTSDGTRTYTWDAQNRLVSQASATSGSEFTYDGRSRLVRVIEKTNGVIVNDRRLLWCDLDVCEERDAAGDTVLKRFFANGVLNVSTSQSTYLTRDHLGSIREAGASRFSYDPYGRMTQIAGSEGSDFGYGGLLNHSASGLVLAPYRAYNPGLGRWMSEDPTGLAAGSNRYAFADANPIRFADPLGLDGMDSVSRTIWELIKQGKYREARILLQDSDLALSQEAKKAIQEALKRLETPVRDLIRGRLKTSESYASELEEETFGDLLQSGSKKAKAMCKLVKDSLRLMGKGGDLR